MARDICFKKKCVFRQWIGGTLFYCPFPRCPFVKKVVKQEEKDERTK